MLHYHHAMWMALLSPLRPLPSFASPQLRRRQGRLRDQRLNAFTPLCASSRSPSTKPLRSRRISMASQTVPFTENPGDILPSATATATAAAAQLTGAFGDGCQGRAATTAPSRSSTAHLSAERKEGAQLLFSANARSPPATQTMVPPAGGLRTPLAIPIILEKDGFQFHVKLTSILLPTHPVSRSSCSPKPAWVPR